jgi:methyl-accepting chemotaxis protein
MAENQAEPGDLRTRQMNKSVGTISGVMTDLAMITKQLSAGAERTETIADILDQLSLELGEAARMLRDDRPPRSLTLLE